MAAKYLFYLINIQNGRYIMAQRVVVQDGKISYTSSDPTLLDVDFGVAGVISVTKQLNIGNDPLADGLITTPPATGADLIFRTNTDGSLNGNIKFEPVTGGSILLNNVAWPDGTIQPSPGMYLGVSALNTLQFYTLPTAAAAPPLYELQSATAAQTVFNTTLTTIANSPTSAYLQVFVNGVKQLEGLLKNYTVTGTNQVTFTSGLFLNDDVEFYAFL